MILLVMIICMLLYAVFDAKEEVEWSHPFRYLSDEQYPEKKERLKDAHTWGAFAVAFLCAMGGLVNFAHEWDSPNFWEVMYSIGEGGLGVLLTYWLVFDIQYALGIGQKWFYLGSKAKTDGVLNNLLGKNAGKIKAFLCVSGVLVILVFHFIHHKL